MTGVTELFAHRKNDEGLPSVTVHVRARAMTRLNFSTFCGELADH